MKRKVYMKNKINIKDKINAIKSTGKDKISKQKSSRKIDKKSNEESLGIFERIPKELSEKEIGKIIEFSNEKVIEEIGCARIVPYSVKLTDVGNIKITLVIYNGGTLQFNLPKIPLKLIDANKLIILAELVDINAVVNCGKVGVFQTIIYKEKLRESDINLEEWDIIFAI